jgi:hypothetical protein
VTEVVFKKAAISINKTGPVIFTRQETDVRIISLKKFLLKTVWSEEINHAAKIKAVKRAKKDIKKGPATTRRTFCNILSRLI